MRDFMNEEAMPEQASERDTRTAVLRGWKRKCPNCGAGPLMSGYLKVQDHCAVCGEDLHHHRADDGPAWATILITGHILAPLMIAIYMAWRPEAWEMATGFSLVFTVMALFLLPRLKGMFVGFQWARRMHGFADAD